MENHLTHTQPGFRSFPGGLQGLCSDCLMELPVKRPSPLPAAPLVFLPPNVRTPIDTEVAPRLGSCCLELGRRRLSHRAGQVLRDCYCSVVFHKHISSHLSHKCVPRWTLLGS